MRGPAGALPALPFVCGSHLSPQPAAEARREAELGGAPVRRGDSHSFPLTHEGKSFSSTQPPGLPAVPAPQTSALSNYNIEIPCSLPPASPFPLHPYLPRVYLATIRVFLSSGEVANGARRAGIPRSWRARPALGAERAGGLSASPLPRTLHSNSGRSSWSGRVSFRILTGDR